MTTFQNARVIASNVSNSDYQKSDTPRGNPAFVMSRSQLMEFSVCPSRWLNGYGGDGSKATEWGTVIDALVFGFEGLIATAPESYPAEKKGGNTEMKPWNYNATFCKDWRSEQESMGRTCLKHGEWLEACKALETLYTDPDIKAFIDCSKTQVLVTADYHDADTGIVVPVKTLIDLVPETQSPYGRSLGDLKTCRSAARRAWRMAVDEHDYDAQAALNLDLYSAATGEDRNTFYHLLQENFAPWTSGKRMLSTEFVTLGRGKYRAALRRYAKCLATNDWPAYETHDDPSEPLIDGWQIVGPEPWMQTKAMDL